MRRQFANPRTASPRRTDGTVFAWGSNNRGQTTAPPGLSTVTAVFAGLETSADLTRSPVVASPVVATNIPALAVDPVRLVASVQGLGPLFLLWLANGQPIPGETKATLLLGPASPALDATYTLRAPFANPTPGRRFASPPVRARLRPDDVGFRKDERCGQ